MRQLQTRELCKHSWRLSSLRGGERSARPAVDSRMSRTRVRGVRPQGKKHPSLLQSQLTKSGQGIWHCRGAESGAPFNEVDLEDGEWVDYDEKGSVPVGISNIKSSWNRA
jgi:hypothetical protein